MEQSLTTTETSAIQQQMQWAKLASSADILPDAYKGKPADILVAVGFGASMGLSFSDSLYRINVIKGKPTMSAELIASQVRKAGHRLRTYKDDKSLSVKATIVRADDPDFEFEAIRDAAWAKLMGLDTKDNYRKQAMTMLTWRAISAVAREACPEALFGAGYTPDEVADFDTDKHSHELKEETIVAEVVASPKQRNQLLELMKKAGVDSSDKARKAFQALTGADIDNVKDLPSDDVLLLLDNPEMVISRTREALEASHEA